METSLRGLCRREVDVNREDEEANRAAGEEDDFDASTFSLLDDIEGILAEMREARNDLGTPHPP